MKYKYELPEKPTFSVPSTMGFVYCDETDNPNIDASRIIVDGFSEMLSTGQSDRLYLVLAGEGEFTIGQELCTVHTHDVMMIPRHTEYSYRGSMELFAVNTPAFVL